jgi:hypothetical protein
MFKMAHNNLINHMGKPPRFDGSSYGYWKKQLKAHLKSMNWKMWEIIEKYFVVIDMNDPTPRDEEKLQFNDIALNARYSALDEKVFEQIKDLEYAYEVWKKLEDTYEGTTAIKGAKLYILKD